MAECITKAESFFFDGIQGQVIEIEGHVLMTE